MRCHNLAAGRRALTHLGFKPSTEMQFLYRQKVERRRWKRHWLNAPVRLLTDSAIIDGRSIRLSEGGIYLFALANLALGDQIRIEYLPTQSDPPLSRNGIVRNRAIYLYGIEFFDEEPQPEHTKLALPALNSLSAPYKQLKPIEASRKRSIY